MKVQGNFIAVVNPLYKKSVIELDEATKSKMMQEEIHKLDKLKIAELGEGCTIEGLKVGSEVYVNTDRLHNCPRTVVDDTAYIFLRETDIIFIY